MNFQHNKTIIEPSQCSWDQKIIALSSYLNDIAVATNESVVRIYNSQTCNVIDEIKLKSSHGKICGLHFHDYQRCQEQKQRARSDKYEGVKLLIGQANNIFIYKWSFARNENECKAKYEVMPISISYGKKVLCSRFEEDILIVCLSCNCLTSFSMCIEAIVFGILFFF